jgi:hypothetical protein
VYVLQVASYNHMRQLARRRVIDILPMEIYGQSRVFTNLLGVRVEVSTASIAAAVQDAAEDSGDTLQVK